MNTRHLCNERVALGHVANQSFDLICVGADVAAKDSRGTGRGWMKTEERMNQRGLARTVRTKQADRSTAEFAVQAF